MNQRAADVLTGRHVFYWITGFFAVIIVVNVIMAVLALSTFNGVTNDNAYVDGLAYNSTLAAVEAQRQRGWAVETDIRNLGAQQLKLSATFADATGHPLSRLDVTAEFIRPVAEGSDFSVPMTPQGAGTYQVEARAPLPGQWDIRIVARQHDGLRHVLTRRTIVR